MSLTLLENDVSVLDHKFIILPVKHVPTNMLVEYWMELYESNRLADRLGDIKDPSPLDAYEMLNKQVDFEFFIVDVSKGHIVGEFNASPISAKMGTIHFSTSPRIAFKEAIPITRWVLNKILNEWKPIGKPDEPYLTSLIGLTPALNRRACLFITKVGFTRVMEIPYGCHYKGEPSSALMSIMHSKVN